MTNIDLKEISTQIPLIPNGKELLETELKDWTIVQSNNLFGAFKEFETKKEKKIAVRIALDGATIFKSKNASEFLDLEELKGKNESHYFKINIGNVFIDGISVLTNEAFELFKQNEFFSISKSLSILGEFYMENLKLHLT